MGKVIVCVAPVAAAPLDGVHNPQTPVEVAEEVIACASAGASMVHLHVRDEAGKLTDDLLAFSVTLDLIGARSEMVIQGSTGGVSDLSLDQRCVSLNEIRVESASLTMGSVNLDDGVYINTLPDIRYWAGRMRDGGIRPELEIFEGGMVGNASVLMEGGYLSPPLVFSFCLGFRGALPASPHVLQFLRSLIPAGSPWGVVHHGMTDLSLLATAVGMGAAAIRVGFEDSCWYAPGRRARTNAELVEKAVGLVRSIGLEAATPDEARKMFGLSDEGVR